MVKPKNISEPIHYYGIDDDGIRVKTVFTDYGREKTISEKGEYSNWQKKIIQEKYGEKSY